MHAKQKGVEQRIRGRKLRSDVNFVMDNNAKKYKTNGCKTRATRICNEMVSRASKLTIKAYVEQIIQVFPYLFITTDFFCSH